MDRTQEMIKGLFLSIAISLAALIAGTSSAAAAVTRCDGTLTPGTYDTVIVPKGKNCVLGGGVIVEQNVILQEGASLTNSGGFIVNGNLQGDGVNSVLIQRVRILGNVSISGATGEVLAVFVEIDGNLNISGATGEVSVDRGFIGGNLNISDSNGSAIEVSNSRVGGNALFQDNTVPSLVIDRNTIFGNLVCNGNDPAPVGVNLVVGQTIGQCKLP